MAGQPGLQQQVQDHGHTIADIPVRKQAGKHRSGAGWWCMAGGGGGGGWEPYPAEGLNLVGVGAVPSFPEGKGSQAVLNDLSSTPQRLRMHLHHPDNP